MMKSLRIILVVLVIGLSGCAAPTTPVSPTQTITHLPPTSTPTQLPPTQTPTMPPVCQSLEIRETPSDLSGKEVVSEMVERLNTGDVTGSMAFFAEDARSYIFGVPPSGLQFSSGKGEICRTMAGYTSKNVEWELNILSSINSYGGTVITAKSKIWLDNYREIEMAPLEFFEKFWVLDGKIAEYSSWLQKASLSKLRPNLSETLSSKPDSSSEIPGSEVTIVFSNGTCTYEGPAVWKSGEIDFTIEVKDQKELMTGLILISLDEGYDIFDLAVATGGDKPPWVKYRIIYDLGKWDTETVKESVTGNPRYLMCYGRDENTVIGLYGPYEVRP